MEIMGNALYLGGYGIYVWPACEAMNAPSRVSATPAAPSPRPGTKGRAVDHGPAA
jgi:hypothetical protein